MTVERRRWGSTKVAPGQRYNKLTVICEAPFVRRTRWICLCDCGAKKAYTAHAIATGHVKSCGCLLREVLSGGMNRTHGHGTPGKSPTYRTWQHMMSRCYSAGDDSYFRYGARGISVCDRWHSFENFLADMGERPSGTSLDRIDGRGNYESQNCRWATPQQQAQNTTRAKLNERAAAEIRAMKGGALSGMAIAKLFGVSRGRVYEIWHGRSWTHVTT